MEYPVFKKTRIAPTPSGYLHLGNILSFTITAALAKKANAKILLRIDDADRERTNKLYVQDIFDTLNFLEIPWDEGPRNIEEYERQYSQVHRIEIYTKALQQLRVQDYVFACTCTRTDLLRYSADSTYAGTCREKHLPFDAENTCWRLLTDNIKELSVRTLEGKIATTLPTNMQDFVVRKKDGFAGYQLTSLLDDLYFGVDMVVRGEDLWPSTLSQLYLADVLGLQTFQDTVFYHHPLIIGPDGKKLSKSEGATSIHHLRKEHKIPADIYAMICSMVGVKAAPVSWDELVGVLRIG